ncbi:MAG TPA: hypothetical protein VNL17_12665 [Verrucomicrobiae bacterium]|nr:hypothetical protein [Verrucomicrobiae bacterium]
MNLHLDETIRRNLRKTPDERVETLMAALREVEARGQWPKTDRKAKEQRILCSIRDHQAESARHETTAQP